MSKFDEMCQAMKEGRERAIAERDACFDFLWNFMKGFAEYCEIPEWRVIPPSWTGEDRNELYHYLNAIRLNEKSG